MNIESLPQPDDGSSAEKRIIDFPPEERAGIIREIPRAERKEVIATFIEHLTEEQIMLAGFYEEVTRRLRENPSLSGEDLRAMLYEDSQRTHLGNDAFSKALGIILRIEEELFATRKIPESFSSANEFFEYYCEEKPQGRVEVVVSGISFFFICHNLADYTRLIQGPTRNGFGRLTETALENMKKSGGCFLGFSAYGYTTVHNGPATFHRTLGLQESWGDSGIFYGPILDQKAQSLTGDERSQFYVFTHETRHAMHSALYDYMEPCGLDAQRANPKDRTAQEAALAHERLFIIEPRTKDEILAYLEEGYPLESVAELLLRSNASGGLYDYFGEYASRREIVRSSAEKLGEKEDSFLHVIKEQKTHYEKVLHNALRAVHDLLSMPEMNRKKAVGLLQFESLRFWPRTVHRFGEQNFPGFHTDQKLREQEYLRHKESLPDGKIDPSDYEEYDDPAHESHRHPRSSPHIKSRKFEKPI